MTGLGGGTGTPSGEVSVGSGASGAFAPAISCALVASGVEQSSCQVSSAVAGAQLEVIDAAYSGDTTHAASTGTTFSTEPPNHFRLSRPRLNRHLGIARILVTVPGPGRVLLVGKNIRRRAKSVAGAGRVVFVVRPIGRAARRLRKAGAVRLVARFTFTPGGGLANTVSRKLELNERLGSAGRRAPLLAAGPARRVQRRSIREGP